MTKKHPLSPEQIIDRDRLTGGRSAGTQAKVNAAHARENGLFGDAKTGYMVYLEGQPLRRVRAMAAKQDRNIGDVVRDLALARLDGMKKAKARS